MHTDWSSAVRWFVSWLIRSMDILIKNRNLVVHDRSSFNICYLIKCAASWLHTFFTNDVIMGIASIGPQAARVHSSRITSIGFPIFPVGPPKRRAINPSPVLPAFFTMTNANAVALHIAYQSNPDYLVPQITVPTQNSRTWAKQNRKDSWPTKLLLFTNCANVPFIHYVNFICRFCVQQIEMVGD